VKGIAPVDLMPVGDDMVVGATATDAVSPGEAVLAIDGEKMADALARIERLTSSAPHEKAEVARQYLFAGRPSATIHVRGLDGAERDVALTSTTAPPTIFGMWDRPVGPLTDLGAPDVFYATLDGGGPNSPSQTDASVYDKGLAAARAVVLDMRGYPEPASWDLLARVLPSSTLGPKFGELDVTANAQTISTIPSNSLGDISAVVQTFTGPVALLVGPETISQAETLTSFFVNAKRGKVIGSRTSGANGDITGVRLPGGYGFSFSGLSVTNQDGTRFFGLGFTPDSTVEPTAGDVHAHRDAVLLRAIEVLRP
jgi:hypothetical protein